LPLGCAMNAGVGPAFFPAVEVRLSCFQALKAHPFKRCLLTREPLPIRPCLCGQGLERDTAEPLHRNALVHHDTEGSTSDRRYLEGSGQQHRPEAHPLLTVFQMRSKESWEASWETMRTILQEDPIESEQEVRPRVAIDEDQTTMKGQPSNGPNNGMPFCSNVSKSEARCSSDSSCLGDTRGNRSSASKRYPTESPSTPRKTK
jgi:hypothetical protein